ncbi:GNAT family N-acetyltransferase [Pararhodobacter marinus]|uniref:GNAT family N-acetyltransferase n=1 Tax=Pararhodobacter marinus TaxID=2184063 RepID=UPI0035147C33
MTDDSLRPAAEALYLALKDDPFYAALEAVADHPDGPREAMLRYYLASMAEAERFGLLSLAPGKARGAAIWWLPQPPAIRHEKAVAQQAALQAAIGSRGRALYNRICAFMSDAGADLTAQGDWYLSILGLHPDDQGQGLGRALIEPMIARADAEGAATYLETFVPRNHAFYRRLGYREAGAFTEPETDSRHSLMRRPAGG